MALVALASARSPGLTTGALALATAWPQPRRALVAELDPSGGTIACWRAVNPDPGLQSLAAAGRHYLDGEQVLGHARTAPDGQALLLSPPSPDRCAAALTALNAAELPDRLRNLRGFDVLADCGRLDSSSPALPVFAAADAVIFVVRPTISDIAGLRSRLETLSRPASAAGLVVVDHGRYGVGDVVAAFDIPVLGVLPWEPRAADVIGTGGRLARPSKLVRAAGPIAAAIARQLPDAGTEAPPSTVTAWPPVWRSLA
jgi:hypothetical protein